MNPRSRLLTAVVASCVVAAALGFYVVMQGSPEAARNRLLIDVLLLAALSASVFVVTRNPLERREELLDAMRALSRGVRERRLEVERFGDLEDVARSYNELAAALTEHEDPNLGPVKARRRQERPSWMEPDASEHPELGEVRVISKKEKAAPAKLAEERAAKAKSHAPDEPLESAWDRKAKHATASTSDDEGELDLVERPDVVADADSDDAPDSDGESSPPQRAEPSDVREAEADPAPEADDDDEDESGGLEEAAADNDTAIDDLLTRSELPTASAATAADSDPPRPAQADTLPPFDMRALFREFVEAKRAHDEDTDDLEYEAFAETLEDEMGRLVQAHGCRAVRFEVRVQDGEVSLLPRLLR